MMASATQPDLFATEREPDLFGLEANPVYRADPDQVRADLHKILLEARAAQKMPWEPTRVSLYRTIFPQMTNWLPAVGGGPADRMPAVGRGGFQTRPASANAHGREWSRSSAHPRKFVGHLLS